jgi:hypothetical protein
MAKIPDESTDVSSKRDPKNIAAESDEGSSYTDSSDEVKSTENIVSDATPSEDELPEHVSHELLPSEDIISNDEPSEEAPPENASSEVVRSNHSSEFLTTEGQNPAVIPAQINLGEGIGDDAEIAASILEGLDEDLLLQQVSGVFMLWWHWAYFEITVTSPTLPSYHPVKLVLPERTPGGEEFEFVYNISDWGNKLSTSKGSEMYSVGMSMCKMCYTIEKIIFILINRLKEQGVATDAEVQVTFDGHLLGQRKAFESIINLNYNVVVTNFDPGAWGERYLEIVKRFADKGYGYPSEAPRDIYKIKKKTVSSKKP